MLDCHIHLVPEVDDGPQSQLISDRMLAQLVDMGVNELVATPHYLHPRFELPSDMQRRCETWQASVQQQYPQLAVHLGAENHISGHIPLEQTLNALTALGSSRAYLLELPDEHCPPMLWDLCWRLLMRGDRPIIAHPERCPSFLAQRAELDSAVAQGVLLQLDLANVLGDSGRKLVQRSRKLMKHYAPSCLLASDAHDCDVRPPLWNKLPAKYHSLVPQKLEDLVNWQ